MQRLKHHTTLSMAREIAALADVTAQAFAGHEEWLLDESLRETFPASDPISPAVRAGSAPGPKHAVAPARKRAASR